MLRTIVGSVLFAGNESFRVEQAAVGASPDLIDDTGLEVNVEGAGNVFAGRRFRKEGAKATPRGTPVYDTTIGLSVID